MKCLLQLTLLMNDSSFFVTGHAQIFNTPPVLVAVPRILELPLNKKVNTKQALFQEVTVFFNFFLVASGCLYHTNKHYNGTGNGRAYCPTYTSH